MNADIVTTVVDARDRAVVVAREGRLDEAQSIYRQILAHDPAYVDAHVNLGLLRLLLGDFEEGWREFEWREQRDLPLPRWDGGRLQGELVVLHAEQGIGDNIQFLRFAPTVIERGARVAVFCLPGLKRLFGTAPWDIHVFSEGDAIEGAAFEAPFFSLPGILGTTVDAIPAPIPYLAAEPDLADAWRERLSGAPGLKVGLCWRGNPDHPSDAWRSLPLEALAPVLATAGVTFYSLQVGPAAAEAADVAPDRAPVDLSGDLGGGADRFVEDAALMEALDLVITVDTAVAHLAGALGRPVWVLLQRTPDWRWLLDRADSPWYPSARLFRQSEPGLWEAPVQEMAAALAALAGGGSPPAP